MKMNAKQTAAIIEADRNGIITLPEGDHTARTLADFWQAVRMLDSAAEGLQLSCDVWTDDREDAQRILQAAARKCRIEAIAISKRK